MQSGVYMIGPSTLILGPSDSDLITPLAFLGLQLDDSRLWDFSASVTWEPVPVINPNFHMYL